MATVKQLIAKVAKTFNKPNFLQTLRDDPCFFAEKILNWKPYPYQAEFLTNTVKAKRIVLLWGRQTGKTEAIAKKVIHFAFTRPKTTTLIVSRGLRQSMLMFSHIAKDILSNRLLKRCVTKSTRTTIQLSNGSQIFALPCGPDGSSLRGYAANLAVIDEASFVPEEVITSVVFPMLATTDGTMIMLSTPWGRDHVFYRSFTNPKYWCQKVTSDQCPAIKPSFLEEQRKEIGDLRFRIEYMCEFIDDQTSFFKQDLIRRCIDEYDLVSDEQIVADVKFDGSYVLGCDLGKKVDFSVISLLKIEEDVLKLIYLKRFPLETDYADVVGWIQRLNSIFDIRRGCVDQTGVGEIFIEELRRTVPQLSGVVLTAKTKQDIMTFLLSRMQQGRLTIPFERELIAQINEQGYRFGKARPGVSSAEKGVMQFYHPEGRHDDQLWSLALAVYSTAGVAIREPQVEFGEVA